LADVTAAIERPAVPDATLASDQPIRVVQSSDGILSRLQSLLAAVVGPIAGAGIVLVLMIFILLNREDLRNRIVRLSGKHFALTTRTLDDLATRISRYLVATAMVNGGYGAVVAAGLWLIGVDYAVLWGATAGLLRFIPYIGPAIGVSLPIGMALVQFPADDWSHPLIVVGFLLVVETLTNVVIEPLTYGYSIGVSIVALLVSAIFWSWVWGPLGLLLSVPITVTLVVLGEYVPALDVLAVILGDKPPLENHVVYYQRLLAGDVDEANSVLDAEAASVGLLEAYDAIAIRAVVMAERDLQTGKLTTPEHDSVVEATADYVTEHSAEDANESSLLRTHIVGCPVRDPGDEMALGILRAQFGEQGNGSFEILSSTTLASEMIATIDERNPDAVCLSSMGPLGRRQLRYLCKRIRQKHPQIRIIVGNWGYPAKDAEKMAATLKTQCGADVVFTSLSAAHEYLQTLAPRASTVVVEAPATATPLVAASA
jgi:hypothetical protein